jgi:hypothetical protein
MVRHGECTLAPVHFLAASHKADVTSVYKAKDDLTDRTSLMIGKARTLPSVKLAFELIK